MRLIDPQRERSALSVAAFTAAVFSLLPLSTDLYLPSLPGLRQDLGISGAEAQLTLSMFIVAFGIAQLFWGPVSDRFGRRPALIAGISLYMLATVACMFSPSIEYLVAARFAQGFGACSGQVMARAIIRDLYEPREGARILAYMMLLFLIGPLFGPLIGGHLTVWFGWRANFAFLLVFGVCVMAATWTLLGETNRDRDPVATSAARFLANARIIWSNRTFIGYTLCVTFSYCGVFTFLSAFPFVLKDVFNVPVEQFGWWFMAAVSGNVVGATLCSRLTHRLALADIQLLAGIISTAGGVAIVLFSGDGSPSPLGLIVPMIVYLIGHGITTPVCLAAAVGPFPTMAGTASGLLGVTQLLVASVVGQVVLRNYDGTTRSLAFGVGIFGVAVLLARLLLIRRG
jgi:DHA1 family bicyclomycin/chloramphenicol resistance-like MFS transporter